MRRYSKPIPSGYAPSPSNENKGRLTYTNSVVLIVRTEANNYDGNGAQTAKSELQTAGTETLLAFTADRRELQADGESLCFVTLQLTDENGIPKVTVYRLVEIHICGPGTLLGFGSAKACIEEIQYHICLGKYDSG